MHVWLFVKRKPTHVGRESHTNADCETGAIIFAEPYEGKILMQDNEFVSGYGANPEKAMRCVKPWFGSERCVILDSGFSSLKCVKGMAKHGMFAIGNVKTAYNGFPKNWLKENAPSRGQRSCATTTIIISTRETWSVLTACDKGKQPMTLIGTKGTTSMGNTLQRNLTIIRLDGSWDVRSTSLVQWNIHDKYRRHFNAIDKHSSKRQGLVSFEDTSKTPKWWLRDLQMLAGMSEIDALLLWRRFKHGEEMCDGILFRR